jgi:glycosyltransferase involved in cell wall biosynthesis
MTKPHVVHVATRMALGGAEENTLYTVNGLDPARYRVSLITGRGSNPATLARLAPHVELVEVPQLVRDISPRNDAVALAAIRRYLRAERCDIIHTHMSKAGILGRAAARMAGVPVIVHTVHGSVFNEHVGRVSYGVYWTLEWLAAKMTDRMISVGEDLRRRQLAAGIGTPGQYQVIRSGMELEWFADAAESTPERRRAIRESLGVPVDVPLIGKVARLEHPKGHEFFFDMAERVSKLHPTAHFVALGAGDLLDQFQADVDRRGLAERVHFAGFRPDIADVLAALDVVVLTSLMEGLPRALVQAAATGVPIVTFEVEGAAEIVREGVNGYIVPSKDVSLLTERVSSLLDDPVKAEEMGRAGRSLVSQAWTVESMVREISAVYDELWAARA